MKKGKFAGAAVLFSWIALWILPFSVLAMDLSVDPADRIYDYAGLFSETEKAALAEQADALAEKYQMDYAVVTIDDDEGLSSVDYAQDFYDYNAFAPDGLLLLINMDYRELVICGTGRGEYIYNESQIDRMLDEVYEGAADGDFCAAAQSFFEEADRVAARATESAFSRNLRRLPFFLLIAAAAGGISVACMVAANKQRRRATQASAYINEELRLSVRNDQFLRSAVTRTRRNPDNGGSHGGPRGGSSIGSSGRSHSVGSRRF